MTGSKSSYVVQKLISVLPSSELGELHQMILANLLPLSLDKVGCRVIQFLLEFSSPEQQTQITKLLADPRTLVRLATNPHGTYVAQVRPLDSIPFQFYNRIRNNMIFSQHVLKANLHIPLLILKLIK